MGWKLPALSAVIAVIALTVIGVLAGVMIHGTAGALLGAIPGAMAGVVAGYVPGFRDRADRRRAELKRRADETSAVQAAWAAIGEPAGDDMGPGLAGLLRPEQAVVDFTGRTTELDILRKWSFEDQPRSLRLLVGAGGVGKTRLALQIAAEWEAAGGIWQLVAAGHEASAVAASRGVTSGAVLLILDYAETRSGLVELLRAVLDDRGPLRVLMLSRSVGEWWDRLVEESAPAITRLITAAEPIRLDSPVMADVPDAELAVAAVPFFAHRLKLVAPRRVEFELPAQRVPILMLHTAALLSVLRESTDPAGSLRMAVTREVFTELLEHEARYWRRTATAAKLAADGPVIKSVVAAAVLLGATDLEEAARVAGRVPDLAGTHDGQLRRWARWLYGLYPAGQDGRLGHVQPDLVAEAHAATQLAADPGLARACLRNLTEDQAERALTVLARAWALHDEAKQVIAAALEADLPHLAAPASKVALQTKPEVGMLLAEALTDAPASLEVLIATAHALPYPSVALAQADLAVTLRVRNMLPPGTDQWTAAEWADRAGSRLSQLGRKTEALLATQEAASLYRELARDEPKRHRRDLAQTLMNLGIRFGDLGRQTEALLATQEAASLYRELARDEPERHRRDLAQTLMNLGIQFAESGRPVEALPATQEAASLYRELAQANPDQYRPDLARLAANLGVRFAELGRPAEALTATQEAASLYRELAQADPDQYRPALARALLNLGALSHQAGHSAEALQIAREAIDIFRELAVAIPDEYRPYLAMALTNLGGLLKELGRPAEALPVGQEAVGLYRELAQAFPDRYRLYFAASLSNLGEQFSELDQSAEALLVFQEAVAVLRELEQAASGQYRPYLAGSLTNLGGLLTRLGRPSEALPVAQEAVGRYRDLAQAIPNLYQANLAESLDSLADVLSMLSDDDAATVRAEAQAIRELL